MSKFNTKDAGEYYKLGVKLQNLGKLKDAEVIYRQALELKPDFAKAHLNLGNIVRRSGKLREAEASYRLAIKYKPDLFEAYNNLGLLLHQIGNLDESATIFGKAIIFNPDFFEAYNNLGNVLKKLGNLKEAEASYRQALELKPDFAKAHFNLGILVAGLGRLNEAVAIYRKVIKFKSDYYLAHYNLGFMLHEINNFDEAVTSYRQAIALKPDYFRAHNNLGVTLQSLGRIDEAKDSYQKAIELKPDYFEAHNNLGVTFRSLGRIDEAKDSYRQAIAINPEYSVAYRYLTQVKTFKKKDEEYSKMQELYLDKTIPDKDLCDINFALAKACEDMGDVAQAFKHYSEGNRLGKKLMRYDISQDIELFNQLKSGYAKLERNSLKSESNVNKLVPIVIVGMPRSGTTLVEQIISSHSQVTGAGELPFAARFGHLLARGLSETNTNTLLDFREKYLDHLYKYSNQNRLVTDKTPQNFRFLGLLVAAFPEIKIVHVKRDPSALCWANYKQYFATKSLGYSYSIDDIIKYHSLYENLMGFWEEKLENKIYNLNYELLTIEQESETRKLIKHLNLKWEKECLLPQNNKRVVTTASNIQIRKKVYKGSSKNWEKFKPFLKGAFDFI